MTNTSDPSSVKRLAVKNQLDLLQQVLKSPSSLDRAIMEKLLPALISQGAFAALQLPELGIYAMALNTQKAIANELLRGGYDELDRHRKAARERLTAVKESDDKPGRGTLQWHKKELDDKKSELERMADEISLMSDRLADVLRLAGEMAIAAGREAEFNKRRLEILRKYPKK